MELDKKEDKQVSNEPQKDNILTELSNLANSQDNIIQQKKRTKGLRGKKKLMIQALINSLGVITDACNQVGIERTTHYFWMRTDPLYAKATIEAEENYKDLIQKTIAKVGLIDKHPSILLHLAKTKLRDRGYGEYITTEHIGDNRLIVEIVNGKDKNNSNLPDERGSSSEQ